jgi:LPS-assembly lipoprotein
MTNSQTGSKNRLASLLCLTLVMLGSVSLTGCGFEPVYGGRSGEATRSTLAAIKIAPIKTTVPRGEINSAPSENTRLGQLLRNELENRFARGGVEQARYRLEVTLIKRASELAVQSNDSVTRLKLDVHARFTLIDTAKDHSLYSGNSRALGSYNVVQSQFATVISEQDAERRAASDLAADIEDLLIAYFQRSKPAG